MSNTIVGVFSSYEDAKGSISAIRREDHQSQITIMNRLPKIEEEQGSLKLDGTISGVSDVFVGMIPFVNPLSAVDLPPQPIPNLDQNQQSRLWETYGIEKREADRIQGLIEEGKTIVAIKTDQDTSFIEQSLHQYHADTVQHYPS